MKTIITITLILCSIGVSAQVKIPKNLKTTSTAKLSDFAINTSSIPTGKYVYSDGYWNTKYKAIDTVACLMHLKDTTSPLIGWQDGYVVLIDGGVSTDYITWKIPFIPMAIGKFNNVFLGPDKKPLSKDELVIQLILK